MNNYNPVDEFFNKSESTNIELNTNNTNNKKPKNNIKIILLTILGMIISIFGFIIFINGGKTFTVKIVSNGANVSSTKVSCDKEEKSCKVVLPEITREGYVIEGYVENKDEKIAKYKSLEEIELTSNKTLYVLTSKTIGVRINKNGATSIDQSILNCTIYNNDKSCKVILPNIIREGWTILGYSEESHATIATYKVSEEIELTENEVLYAITHKKITIKFETTGLESIEYTSQSCDSYNENGCYIKLPSYTVKKGYLLSSLVDSNGSVVDSNYRVIDDCTIYTDYLVKDIGISEQVTYGKTTVEFQDTFSGRENTKKYLDEIYKNWPFLFGYDEKVMFLDWDTYEKYVETHNGKTLVSVGMYFPVSRNVVIRGLEKSAIIHELAHRLDFNYLGNGMRISNTDELKNLYKNYATPNSLYLSEYAHTDYREFFAVAVEQYYLKYIDGNNASYPYYPDDLKQFVEKYLK